MYRIRVDDGLVLMCFLLTFMYADVVMGGNSFSKRGEWCVLKGNGGQADLVEFIRATCEKREIDCQPIHIGRVCYFQGNVEKHASYVLNLNFVEYKQCDKVLDPRTGTQLGIRTQTNPSKMFPITYSRM